jgi:ferredoxin
MAVPLTILTDPRRAEARRELAIAAGTSILAAAHAAGIDLTATCGGRGRCTSCRVKFVAGAVPPPTIGDEVQLGDALVREGYRLACQCAPTEAVTVQVAPPLEETAFQILGSGTGVAGRVVIASGVDKQLVKVALPREEHHQTSDVEQLAAEVGVAAAEVPPGVLTGLPQSLRDDPDGVTVTTFAGRILAVERGDTTSMRFGLAIDVGPTTVVTTLLELTSGE